MEFKIIIKGRLLDTELKNTVGGVKPPICKSGFISMPCVTILVDCGERFKFCQGVPGKTVCGGNGGDHMYDGTLECTDVTLYDSLCSIFEQ
mgnify:FL=1